MDVAKHFHVLGVAVEIQGVAPNLLLCGKAVQNIPLIGVIGGAGDAVIMDRARRYAAIKYEKRFLLRWRLERD